MTRRRKLLILIAAAPALLVMIVLLYLNLADLSGWRDTVAKVASDAIGRELRINGEFVPEIGFTTRVVATDITLANADWSADREMVSVDRLAGEIDLLSILFGPITIPDVEITGARVLFEVDPEGRFNWALGDGEPGTGGGGDAELVIGHALLDDAQLIYARPQEQPLEATLSKLEFTDDGTGMLDLDLVGSLDGVPVEISGRLGTLIGLINASHVEHDLSGRFADAEFALRGTIDDLSSLDGVNGNASLSGLDIAQITAALGIAPVFDGPFTAEVSVREFEVGSAFDLDAAAGEIRAELAGTVDSLVRPGTLDVAVDVSGPDVAAVGAIAGIEDLPAKPFAASGRVQWAGFPLTCENVEVRVGDNRLSANGVLGEPPLMMGTNFEFSGGGPDISAVAALAGLELPRESYSVDGRLVRLEKALGVEEVKLEVGRIALAVNGRIGDPPEYDGTALGFRAEGPNLARLDHLVGIDLPAEPFEVSGRLAQGEGAIDLEAVRAQLGRNTLQVSGQLSTENRFVGTDLRVKAAGPDGSQVAALADLSTVPDEAFSVEGRVRVLASGYRVHDFAGSIGSLDLTADGFVAPPPTLIGSDLRVHIEDADLSHVAAIADVTGLPHDAISIATRLRVEEAGYRLDDLVAMVGDMEVAGGGLIRTLPELDGTQVRFTAGGPRLSSLNPYIDQTGLPPAPFSVSGNVRVINSSYALDSVVAEVDGNRITLDGEVFPVKGLVGTDLRVEFATPNLGRVGHLLSGFAELPELPAQPLTATTRLEIEESGYLFEDFRTTMGSTRVAIDGRLGHPPVFVGTDLTIDGDETDAALFTALTGVTTLVAPIHLSARVVRDNTGYRFHQLNVRLGEYRAELDGTLGELPRLIGTDLEVHASGPGTGLIQELAGIVWLPDEPFELDGKFSGTPERFSTPDFGLRLGPSDVKGSFTVDITGKPDISARLIADTIDLSRLRQRLEELQTIDEVAAEPETAVERNLVFSDETLDLSVLDKVDADVSLRIKDLVLTAKKLHDLEVELDLDTGRLEIERITGMGQGRGRMDGNLVLEPVANGHRLDADVSMRQIRLDIEGSEIARAEQPPIDIDIDLEAFGASPHELAASANGAMQLVIGKGVMDSRALDLITADILLTLLDAFNPFAKQDAATELQCGVALLRFEDGVAKLEPMAFQSDKMTLLGHGKVDLRTEKLNLEWITKPRKGIGVSASMITNPYIRLGGTLAAPSVQLKEAEAVVSTGAAVATLGLSLVAKGMFDRVTAEKKVCERALEEIEARSNTSSDNPKKKK